MNALIAGHPASKNPDVGANLEAQELAECLRGAGLAEVLDAIRDEDAYTKSGRISIVKVARKLGRHHSHVRRALDRAREIISAAHGADEAEFVRGYAA